MKLRMRDWIATLLVAAVVVPYVGDLVRGSMPFIEDPRGMAGAGLVLGLVAAPVAGRGEPSEQRNSAKLVLTVVSLLVGVAALAFAETFVASALLAVFMVSIVAVLAVHLWSASASPTAMGRGWRIPDARA